MAMLKKINKIKDFGVFSSFTWNADIPEFKTFNLIYGWNYSGKTTLSRVFQCLEFGAFHPDYATAAFELEDTAGGRFNQQFGSPISIRVFNSDFCNKNLQWDRESIEPIFMLGETNAELQKQLAEKRKEIETAETALAAITSTTRERENALEEKMSAKAKTIGEVYSWRNFTKMQFRPYVDEIKSTPAVLSKEDFEKSRGLALSNEIKPIILTIDRSPVDIAAMRDDIEEVLRRSIVDNRIQRLLENKELEQWVETGIKLHEGLSTCEYCGSNIPDARIAELNNHFSQAYKELKFYIAIRSAILRDAKIALNPPLPPETGFYPDLQPQYKEARENLEQEINVYNTGVAGYLGDLEEKSSNPFEIIQISVYIDNREALIIAFSEVNKLIVENNRRTREFDEEKNSAIDQLKYHHAAEFAINENYAASEALIANEKIKQQVERDKIGTLKADALQIEKQLSETVKGAEKANEYLKQFFGKDDLKIEATADNKFKLLRGGHPAKNLSEGEKTAISFAYFITKLEEKNTVLADTIVYIDDPVSSLDSNHLFNIYACIRTTFWDMTAKPVTCKCKQLFVSTHNFEFYTLMRMLPREKRKDDKTIYKLRSIYLIERMANSSGSTSSIKNLPKYLESYKSEYTYLFSLLSDFLTSGAGQSFEQLYNLPNVMRRFLEVYLNFKFLTFGAIDDSIANIIKNPSDCEKVRKFVHYYSHGFSTSKLITYPDLAECTSAVQILLDAIKVDDPIHFQSLMDEVTPRVPAGAPIS